jgi:hypothetical protein
MNPSLLLIPDRYKKDKLYSQIPDSGAGDLTFARNSNATRVNSAGLIEKVRTNELTYSQDFNNWTQGAVTTTTSATANPLDGLLNAQDITPTATTSVHRILKTCGPTNSLSTWSVYAKANGYNFITIQEGGQTANSVSFNLSTGAVATQSGAVGKIEFLASGWYRCSMVHTTSSAPRFDIFVTPTDSTSSYTANGTSGAILFAAQAEVGDIATDYIPTTTAAVSVGITADIPRLDYTGGGCPSLLLEPQRTNSLTFSEQFDNAGWSKADATISANSTTSPDGFVNADKLVENTANAEHVVFRNVSGTGATFSFFAKAAGRNFVAVLSNNSAYSFFNIGNGTLGTIAATSTATITPYGNGWYRCTLFNTHPTFGAVINLASANGTTVYTGDGTSGAFIWGAQLEASATYATSYIPTLGSSVTRLADAASKTGISSLIGQTEGTLYAEVTANTTGLTQQLELGDGTTANRVNLRLTTTNSFQLVIVQAASVVFNQTSVSTFAQGQNLKIAAVYKSGAVTQMFVNGVSVLTGTSGTITGSLSAIFSGSVGGTLDLMNSPVKAILVFPTALTDTQAIELTA